MIRFTIVCDIKFGFRMAGVDVVRNRKRAALLIVLVMLCAVYFFVTPVLGTVTNDGDAHELIILFDISTSMGWNDTGFLAPDALRQIVDSLPSYFNVGLVTFNIDVVDVVPPGSDTRAEINAVLGRARYRNFTSSGTGLSQAMALFSENALSRTIIYMTDGEIASMPTHRATLEATDFAKDVIRQIIASDITVHTIAVGDNFNNRHDETMGLAHATGGHLIRDLTSAELSSAASSIVFDALGVPRHLIGAAQMIGASGRLSVQLPAAGVDSARILIESESPIRHIVVSSGADDIEITTGQRFAIVEITNPTTQTVEIEFMSYGSSEVSLTVEWNLQLMTAADDDGTVRLWLSDNTGENVLTNPFFDGRFIPIAVDGVQSYARVEAGYISLAPDEAGHTVQVKMDALGINVLGTVEAQPTITVPHDPAPGEDDDIGDGMDADDVTEPDDPAENDLTEPDVERERGTELPVAVIIGVAASILVAVLVLFFLIRLFRGGNPEKTKQSAETAENPTPGRASPYAKKSKPMPAPNNVDNRFEFTGKLDVYVRRTPDEEHTGRKFKFGIRREVTLQKIIKKCNIPGRFRDADRIYLRTDRGALRVVNKSDSAIRVGKDKLEGNQNRKLTRGDSVVVDSYIGTELVVSPRFLYQTDKQNDNEDMADTE